MTSLSECSSLRERRDVGLRKPICIRFIPTLTGRATFRKYALKNSRFGRRNKVQISAKENGELLRPVEDSSPHLRSDPSKPMPLEPSPLIRASYASSRRKFLSALGAGAASVFAA